jgi:hypothetical protein
MQKTVSKNESSVMKNHVASVGLGIMLGVGVCSIARAESIDLGPQALDGHVIVVDPDANAKGLSSDGWFDVWPADRAVYAKKYTNHDQQPKYFLIHVCKSPQPDVNAKCADIAPPQMPHSIFVVPDHMTLLPGHSQNVRFMLPSGRHNETEKYYRIRLIPVVPSEIYGFDDQAIKQAKKVLAGVKFFLGLETPLILSPLHPVYKTDVSFEKPALTVKNQGNAMVTVNLVGKCQKNRGKTPLCHDGYFSAHLYPGQSKVYPLGSFQRQVTVSIQEGRKTTSKTYPL